MFIDTDSGLWLCLDIVVSPNMPQLSSWSSTGRVIMQHESDPGLLFVLSARGYEITRAAVDLELLGGSKFVECLWAPDGLAVVLFSSEWDSQSQSAVFWLWEVDSAVPLLFQLEGCNPTADILWSPNSTTFQAYDADNNRLTTWSRQGQVLHTMDAGPECLLAAWGTKDQEVLIAEPYESEGSAWHCMEFCAFQGMDWAHACTLKLGQLFFTGAGTLDPSKCFFAAVTCLFLESAEQYGLVIVRMDGHLQQMLRIPVRPSELEWSQDEAFILAVDACRTRYIMWSLV